MNAKCKEKILTCWIIGISVVAFVIALFLIWHYACHKDEDKLPETLIASLFAISIAVPIILSINLSEFELFGVKFKIIEKVKNIENRQIQNRVVKVNSPQEKARWYLLKDSKTAFQIPNKDTAAFLALGKGFLEEADFTPEIIGTLPDISSAVVKYNGHDVFILYNDTLYYQSGMSWVYKLASIQGIDFSQGTHESWRLDHNLWAQPLNAVDFIKFEIAT